MCIGRLVIWTQWRRVHQILFTARYQMDRFDRPATWCCLFVPFRCRHSLQILPSLSDASSFSFCVQFCKHRCWISARLYATNFCRSLLLFCDFASCRCLLSFTKFYRNPSPGFFKFYCKSKIFYWWTLCFLWFLRADIIVHHVTNCWWILCWCEETVPAEVVGNTTRKRLCNKCREFYLACNYVWQIKLNAVLSTLSWLQAYNTNKDSQHITGMSESTLAQQSSFEQCL